MRTLPIHRTALFTQNREVKRAKYAFCHKRQHKAKKSALFHPKQRTERKKVRLIVVMFNSEKTFYLEWGLGSLVPIRNKSVPCELV